jgi:hypothetical protein
LHHRKASDRLAHRAHLGELFGKYLMLPRLRWSYPELGFWKQQDLGWLKSTMNLVEVQALVNYYAQKGFYKHVQTLCKDVMKKRGQEPILVFWKAFAMSQEGAFVFVGLQPAECDCISPNCCASGINLAWPGNVADAMREMEPLQGKKDVSLAVASCLVQLHKLSKYKGSPIHRSQTLKKRVIMSHAYLVLCRWGGHSKAQGRCSKLQQNGTVYVMLVQIQWALIWCWFWLADWSGNTIMRGNLFLVNQQALKRQAVLWKGSDTRILLLWTLFQRSNVTMAFLCYNYSDTGWLS